MEKGFVNKIIFCVLLYVLITIACSISCFLLPEFRTLIFCMWYILTLVFWAVTAVVFIVLYYKLIKLTKEKNRFHGKDE